MNPEQMTATRAFIAEILTRRVTRPARLPFYLGLWCLWLLAAAVLAACEGIIALTQRLVCPTLEWWKRTPQTP